MPKIKTHSATKKRFALTASGKVKCTRHILTKMSHKRKRQLRNTAYADATCVKAVKKLLPYG